MVPVLIESNVAVRLMQIVRVDEALVLLLNWVTYDWWVATISQSGHLVGNLLLKQEFIELFVKSPVNFQELIFEFIRVMVVK